MCATEIPPPTGPAQATRATATRATTTPAAATTSRLAPGAPSTTTSATTLRAGIPRAFAGRRKAIPTLRPPVTPIRAGTRAGGPGARAATRGRAGRGTPFTRRGARGCPAAPRPGSQAVPAARPVPAARAVQVAQVAQEVPAVPGPAVRAGP